MEFFNDHYLITVIANKFGEIIITLKKIHKVFVSLSS